MLSAGAYSFRQKSRLAIWLSWVGGYTNAIAFVMLGQIVVSHMTGNVTRVGLEAARAMEGERGAWEELVFYGFIVLAFFAGAVVSGMLTEVGRRRGAASKYMLPIAIEMLLLGGLALGACLLHYQGMGAAGTGTIYVMGGAAAMAMGLQNATITRISGAVVRTTHLTGVVTDLGLEGVQYFMWARDRALRHGDERTLSVRRLGRILKISGRQASFQRLRLLASILGSFLLGAIAGPLVYFHFPGEALGAPVVFLLWIIYRNWRKPIADVREIDVTADAEFRGAGVVREALPPGVGLFRLVHHRHDRMHSAPDFQAWVERLGREWRIIIMAVSPLTRFDEDSAMDLSEAVRKLRERGRDLILAGIKPVQYKLLKAGGLVATLGQENIVTDMELAIARAYGAIKELEGER